MEKFQLNPNETQIGSGMMSIYLKQGFGKKPFQGNIKGFSINDVTLFTQVTIHSWMGETYSFTDFPASIFIADKIGGASAI